MASFCHGVSIGWCGPTLWLLLLSQHSPLQSGAISLYESAWIGSVLFLGMIFGTGLYSVIQHFYGGKVSMTLLAFPNLAYWIIVICAENPAQLIVGRFLAGISSGGAFVCVPQFIAEIASKNIRGVLGSFFMVVTCLGILFGLIISAFVPYRISPYIFIMLLLIFTCGVILLPKAPIQLLMSNKCKEAESSFRFYNFGNNQEAKMTAETRCEFEQLSLIVRQRIEDNKNNRITPTTFFTKRTIKGVSIGLCLTALTMFSGTLCINTYSVYIFNETGAHFNPITAAIISCLVQVIGLCIATLLVDYFGRKILLSISCLGSTVSIFGFALFAYLNEREYVLTSYSWVPVTFISLFLFANTIGIIPLPFIIIAETLPQKTRQIGSTICIGSLGLFAFINLNIFPILSHNLGLHSVMWMYSGVCLLGFFFTVFALEETQGKAMDGYN